MIDWNNIHTVLLDMDGTLLDLHFDNYFWQEYIPACYAEAINIPVSDSQQLIHHRYQQHIGQLSWYCLEFWSEQLKLDIASLKLQVKTKIQYRPEAVEFLIALKKRNKARVLVTNAHPKVLEIKLEHTTLGQHLDHIYSSHHFDAPKESAEFWHRFLDKHHFDPSTTLLIDDSEPVLAAAQRFGIAHLLAIAKPDSQQAVKSYDNFPAIHQFKDLMI